MNKSYKSFILSRCPPLSSSKDTGPSLLGSLSLSSSSPSPAFYSEAKTVSGSSLLNGPLSYSQSSDIIKVSKRRHAEHEKLSLSFRL